MAKDNEGEPDAQALLASLKQKRSRSKANVTRIKNVVENTSSLDQMELECRLEVLNDHIKQLMNHQNDIEDVDNTDNSRGELENICIKAKTVLLKRINALREPTSHLDNTILSNSSVVVQSNRLPTIKIPKFSGKFQEYKNFISSFNKLVHNEPTLTDLEKFHHLISFLSDEALATVRTFQITDANYKLAIKRLSDRYDNKYMIFNNLIESIFTIPKMTQPNASELQNIVDNVSACLESLATLGSHEQILHSMLIYLVMSKIDHGSKAKWDEQLDKELPTWSQCSMILLRRCQFLKVNESSQSVSNDRKRYPSRVKETSARSAFFVNEAKNRKKCCFCQSKEHFIYSCKEFHHLNVSSRFEFAKKALLCINCLKKGHSVKDCNSSSRCRECQKSHHSLLHQNEIPKECVSVQKLEQTPSSSSTLNNGNHSHDYSTQPPQVFHVTENNPQTILATATVNIKSHIGSSHIARVLLDSGSQLNFITEELAHSLRLPRKNHQFNITGIDQVTTKTNQIVTASIQSRTTKFEGMFEFVVIRSISNQQPMSTISTKCLNIPSNLPLADPYFHKSHRIDILLGAETFFELLSVGQVRLGNGLPTLQKTLLGWIISGRYNPSIQTQNKFCHLATYKEAVSFCTLDETLKKFWEVEEIPSKPFLSAEQVLCEDHFKKNTERLPNGRFQVRLPFNQDPKTLGTSFDIARRRFLSLERRLSKNTELQALYMEFMQEYISMGHMTKVSGIIQNTPHYYIPHQCVFKPDRSTTKLRVVFDASCKTSSQKSLNDLLLVGPTIQSDLFTTLLRFRLHKYAISADITKMYRQVIVHPADRRFQLILWRENEFQPIQTYQLNTVTYGTASAPFLAIRCLQDIAVTFKDIYPIGSKEILQSFYVDDLLTGAENFSQLEQIKNEITMILSSAGFTLAKWYTNYQSSSEEKIIDCNNVDATKTLGMFWETSADFFIFSSKGLLEDTPSTKRNILSIASKLFDPLGLVGPLIIKAKIILQELWINKLDWDESIPMHLDYAWTKFKEDIYKIENLKIPRFVSCLSKAVIQVHGFSDASVRAYGCCLYLRCKTDTNVYVHLLTAKSKVAPLKTKTLPRLELCAAQLLVNLWMSIKSHIHFKIEHTYFWSDSSIVLHWLKTHPSTLSTFVGNRIAEIQENSLNATWRHVPSSENPADIISRGCDIASLENSIWFSGPNFLREAEEEWPLNITTISINDETMLETKKKHFVLLSTESEKPNFILEKLYRWSSYRKILRIMAYIIRFVSSCKRKIKSSTLIVSAAEQDWAFKKIVQMIQEIDLGEELYALKNSLTLQPNFQKLSPFFEQSEQNGITYKLIRVGGRLMNSPFPHDVKFPLLLSRKSFFVNVYLQHIHKENHHAGPQLMTAILRQKIWLVNAREATRKIVRQCIKCFRFKPKFLQQVMGSLPADRFTSSRPFYVCGVDFCGPVNVSWKIRGKPPYKAYIAVFVCFSSKAVHLEAVSELSTDLFISCLSRFISRRGLPKTLWCDNGSNFIGAARLLNQHVQNKTVEQFTADKGIEIKFIPPRAPHFGGIWEAAVKSAKSLLLKTTGSANLSFEALGTILAEIECILNSRPLTQMSEDPADLEALTPGHLIIGSSMKALPSADTLPASYSFLKQYRIITALKERFWRVWSTEYIQTLQLKVKWTKPERNMLPGDLVIIHEDNVPPQRWALGRVVNTIAGTDGKVRVAEVRTADGILKRPVVKLAALPLPEEMKSLQPLLDVQPCKEGAVNADHFMNSIS